jgi:hypothetical protein
MYTSLGMAAKATGVSKSTILRAINSPEAARKIADLGASLIVCPANNMCRRKTAEALKNVHNSVRGERCRETGFGSSRPT